MDQAPDRRTAPDAEPNLQDMVAAADTGARSPVGAPGRILAGVALAWSLFQLWIASPLPFMITFLPVLNDTETRSIHLAFAVFLAFTAYPALMRSPRDRVPAPDWVLGAIGAFCAAYLFLFYEELGRRSGLPTTLDLVTAGAGMFLLLEATRRTLGPPLMVVALVFLAYVFFGNHPILPEVVRWKGASFSKAMTHQWLSTEGVFGIALGVSTSFVFLFVLFGSLLDKAGAGNFFIKLAFALLGHLRGGPAKAAVLSSAMTGVISGSSIANVVTTGTFTIPLMKRVGFTAEKAGSVEVASSVNGQIMPPVMGAAAFLMVEYVGIPYVDVVKHAFLPAIISYIALLYLVHLEAMKNDMPVLPKSGPKKTLPMAVVTAGITISSIIILAGAVYYAITGVQAALGTVSTPILLALTAAVYVALVAFAARREDLELDDPDEPIVHLPRPLPVLATGLYYLLPIVVLVWFLMIERNSPGLSAFWAVCLLLVILLTQRPLKQLFRGEGRLGEALAAGFADTLSGLISGARNMVGIGIATATAGIIVGTVTLTGVGQVMAEFVELISAGNLLLMLIFTAIISLILGMGLPTTANYIVVSSLMAGVVVQLAAQGGLIVPLIAVHMFVFYFGIMADVTPPVGLASFAAAAISRGDPLKTGATAFFYSLRTVILPFLFIFNTDLLLIDVGWVGAIGVFISATVAMLLFAAGTQGYFLARSRLWESAALLLVAFTLFRPGFWLDMVDPPFQRLEPTRLEEVVRAAPDGAELRLVVEGETVGGREVKRTVLLPLASAGPGGDVLMDRAGLAVLAEGPIVTVDDVGFGGPAETAGIDFDWRIVAIEMPVERPPKELFYIPGLLLLALVVFAQWRRRPAAHAARQLGATA